MPIRITKRESAGERGREHYRTEVKGARLEEGSSCGARASEGKTVVEVKRS